MDDKASPRHSAIVSALHRVIKGALLSPLARLTATGDIASEQFNGVLEDGTGVVFQRRTLAVQTTEALRQAEDGKAHRLADGMYRLKDGISFEVVGGRIDFDFLFKDPDGVDDFRQYGAWREVVALENPLLTLQDPLAVTDVVRFLSADGNFYHAVQLGVDKPYRAYVVADHVLKPLSDGEYPLPGSGSFRVVGGTVDGESLGKMKLSAFESTRLPE